MHLYERIIARIRAGESKLKIKRELDVPTTVINRAIRQLMTSEEVAIHFGNEKPPRSTGGDEVPAGGSTPFGGTKRRRRQHRI